MGNLLPHRWRVMREAGRHNEAVIGILETAPIRPARDGLVLFGCVGSAAVLPFLVAVKSLWAQLGRGRVAVLDDGTLTAADRTILAQHCGDPQMLRGEDVPRGPFPHGIGWEALLTVLDHRAGEYWLQLDCSTVTLGPLWELERAIACNRSFVMIDRANAPTAPLELAAFAQACSSKREAEVTAKSRIESHMAQIAPGLGWKYLCGCGGLAGFAAGNAGRDLAGAFISRMRDVMGADDAVGLGAAQVTGNFLIANEGAPVCLPHDRYLNYAGADWGAETAVVHFGGAHRYDRGAYMAASRDVIAKLTA